MFLETLQMQIRVNREGENREEQKIRTIKFHEHQTNKYQINRTTKKNEETRIQQYKNRFTAGLQARAEICCVQLITL